MAWTESDPAAPPSRGPAHAAGIVFAVALLAGMVSVVAGFLSGSFGRAADGWSTSAFMQGRMAQQAADALARAPLPSGLADGERAGAWLLTGSLGPRVRRGCDPWLFLADELEVHPQAAAHMQTRLAAVERVRDLLRRRGIELLLATVPDKSRIQSAQRCDLYRPASFAARLGDWEAGLAGRGLHHASLAPALQALATRGQKQPFLRTDTHWSEAGSRAAAAAVAAAVHAIGLVPTPRQRYVMEPGSPEPRQGDLVRLAGIAWLPAHWLPEPDIVAPTGFIRAEPEPGDRGEASGASGDDADDLFGDAQLPSVALLGSSFSRTSSFAEFLQASLGTPVPNFAKDGGDFWGSARDYLAGKDFHDTPPRLVIWEIPERVLQMPISPEERQWLDGLGGPGPAAGSG